MLRLFEQHHVRKVKSLNGSWNFKKTGEATKEYTMIVPSCWEQHPDFSSFRGEAEYKKEIFITEKTAGLRLDFKGISHTADVYFDNQKVAHHYNAYTPFSVVIPNVDLGSHELRVVVDNSFNENSALHIPNDYYSYGGITRGVSMELIPNVFIERIEFTPQYRDHIWEANIKVFLKNIQQLPTTVTVQIDIAGKVFTRKDLNINESTSQVVEFNERFFDIESWSPTNPHLYLLKSHLISDENVIDDLIERVGFREVEIRGNKVWINAEEIFLKGFNRHEDYGEFGCAIPLQLMVHDLDIMQDLGANSVRTCHYPNDELFLDLCDERGIMVWEENHARGLSLAEMKNQNFKKQCENCNREMVENHYNHPSIIIWGILNECASETEEGREMYKNQYDQIRSMDQSRPLTSATCRHFTDICLDLPDIVSFNMYTGWYQDMSVEERHNQELNWIHKEGGEGKPIIVSEFGAGGIYGYRDRARSKWSEERQVDILTSNLQIYLNDPRIMGVFIWQFADCRITEENNWFAARPRSYNNKGIVDEYRRPKMVYSAVKEYFNKV